MKFDLNCKQVTHLVLQREDRSLSWRERLGVRFHLLICKACPRFVRQVELMRGAMGRWKRYGDEAAGGDAPPER